MQILIKVWFMRKESEGVTENLLASARKEFLQYGFHDASLRRISADSGVSTNSIYTRFGDKSGLFTAIVKEAADELMAIYSDSIKKAGEATDIRRVPEMKERILYWNIFTDIRKNSN